MFIQWAHCDNHQVQLLISYILLGQITWGMSNTYIINIERETIVCYT